MIEIEEQIDLLVEQDDWDMLSVDEAETSNKYLSQRVGKANLNRYAFWLFRDAHAMRVLPGGTHAGVFGSMYGANTALNKGAARGADNGKELAISSRFILSIPQRDWIIQYLEMHPNIETLWFSGAKKNPYHGGYDALPSQSFPILDRPKRAVGELMRFATTMVPEFANAESIQEDDDWDLSDVETGGESLPRTKREQAAEILMGAHEFGHDDIVNMIVDKFKGWIPESELEDDYLFWMSLPRSELVELYTELMSDKEVKEFLHEVEGGLG